MRESTTSGWQGRYAGALVVGLALVIFAPTLVFGRVAYDDDWLWSDTSPLRAPTAATWREVWLELDAGARRELGSEYLPVRDLVVAADMAVWGELDQGFHVTQLALYGLTVLGLGGLLIRFGMRRDLAWLSTLIWAIHPIHVESVAWLAERKGILAGLFFVICGHAWIRYRRGGPRGWLLVAALAAVAGTWSKAPAMFGPAVLAAWDAILLPAARRRWIAIAAVGGVTLAAALPVIAVARQAGVVDSQSAPLPGHRGTRALGAQGHYLESLVLARPPAIAYPIQLEGPGPLELALGGAAVLGSIALAVARRPADRRWRLALLAWAWIWFVPFGHVLASVHILVADRFAYLWSLAACAGAAWLVLRLRGPARLAATGAVICALGIASLRAERAWTSSLELFAAGHAASPADAQVCDWLAREQFAEGAPLPAIATVEGCLARHPDDGYLLLRQARMLAQLGRPAEALAAAAHAAQSGYASAMSSYADLLIAAGRPGDALFWAERAAIRRWDQPSYARARIDLLLQLGRDAEAEAVARRLAWQDPRALDQRVLGRVLLRRGQPAEAAARLALARALGAPPP
ncbi:MAG TPA: hypothetical protein VGC42_00625 [Kofleriaceae bacterium]